MRGLTVILGGILLLSAGGRAYAATVEVEDGRKISGQVIVREGVVTINSTQKKQLFQFPISQVIKITGNLQSPNLIRRQTALRAGDSARSEPLQVLEKGLEVKRLAIRRSWVKVEAWKEDLTGFVLETDLASEITFTPNERLEARQRLGVRDIPPPPRPIISASQDSSSESSSSAKKDKSETADKGEPEKK